MRGGGPIHERHQRHTVDPWRCRQSSQLEHGRQDVDAPDLTLDPVSQSPEEEARLVCELLERRGFLLAATIVGEGVGAPDENGWPTCLASLAGVDRSGIGLLADILDQHPEIAISRQINFSGGLAPRSGSVGRYAKEASSIDVAAIEHLSQEGMRQH